MLPFLYVSPVNMAAHLRFLLIDQPLKSLKTSHSFVSLIRSTTKVNTNTPWNNDDERLQWFFLPEWSPLSPSPDWIWHPTSSRRFLQTRCSCGSRCTLRWRALLSRRWCWVSVGTLCTVTASWCGFADWPERTTWRPALHPKTWLANTSGP